MYNFTFETCGDMEYGEITHSGWQVKYERLGVLSKFTFNGKIPSRRTVRREIKDWSNYRD